jgi:outer membrane protein TolC
LSLLAGVAHAEPDAAPASQSFDERMAHELAVAGGLTAESLASRAVATSYVVEARRTDIKVAEENRSRAQSSYIPKVTLQARYTRLSPLDTPSLGNIVISQNPGVIPPGSTLRAFPLSFEQVTNQYAFTASLVIPVSDYFLRINNASGAAEAQETAAKHDVMTAERATATDARSLYYAWVGSRLSVLIAEEALERARAHGADVKNAVEAGTASRADELQVEALIAESERALESARHSQTEYEEQIRIARHDPPATRYAIGEDVRSEIAPIGVPERQEDLVAVAIRNRPELAATLARVEALSRNADTERAAMLPRLDLVANAAYSNPNPRVFPQKDEFRATWDAGAQLTWVVSDLPGAHSATAAARAQAASLRTQAKAQEDQIRRDVSVALQALLDARAQIGTSETSLRAAEESYRVRRALFQNGRATSTELMDSSSI